MNKEAENLIQETIKLQEIKKELDGMTSMSKIADTVDALSESEAKKLLKMYIYAYQKVKQRSC